VCQLIGGGCDAGVGNVADNACITIDSKNVYWASGLQSGSVWSVPVGGGCPALVIGQQIHPGDALLAQGTIYGTPQIVESLYTISSSASATSIQASKTIRADVSLYPQVLSIIPQ
jgi:hypothetical protein